MDAAPGGPRAAGVSMCHVWPPQSILYSDHSRAAPPHSRRAVPALCPSTWSVGGPLRCDPPTTTHRQAGSPIGSLHLHRVWRVSRSVTRSKPCGRCDQAARPLRFDHPSGRGSAWPRPSMTESQGSQTQPPHWRRHEENPLFYSLGATSFLYSRGPIPLFLILPSCLLPSFPPILCHRS